jgi:hypothetical protein
MADEVKMPPYGESDADYARRRKLARTFGDSDSVPAQFGRLGDTGSFVDLVMLHAPELLEVKDLKIVMDWVPVADKYEIRAWTTDTNIVSYGVGTATLAMLTSKEEVRAMVNNIAKAIARDILRDVKAGKFS